MSTHWTVKKEASGDSTSLTITTTSTIPASTSITVTIFEDVGSDGAGASTDGIGNAYDNSASVTLSGGTDETNSLSGFDDTGATNQYWTKVEMNGDGSDPTLASPTLNALITDRDTGTPSRHMMMMGM